MDSDEVKYLKDALAVHTADAPSEVDVTITGGTILATKMFGALTGGRTQMTIIGIGLVFAGLLALFRFRIIRALLALVPIVLIIGWSAIVMYVLGLEYTPLTATFAALIMGIGAEYTILLLSRYDEEKRKGYDPYAAMHTAIVKIGRAISVSAFTTIGGFAALLIAFDFPVLQGFGFITLVDVFFALVSTILVLPPLVVLVDRWRERAKARKAA
jgi:predicted RND superfamily exporter protein